MTSQGGDYEHTRKWAHWLRQQAEWAHGFVWGSLRNRGGLAVVLFGDRCAADFGPGFERTLLHEVTELTVGLDGGRDRVAAGGAEELPGHDPACPPRPVQLAAEGDRGRRPRLTPAPG